MVDSYTSVVIIALISIGGFSSSPVVGTPLQPNKPKSEKIPAITNVIRPFFYSLDLPVFYEGNGHDSREVERALDYYRRDKNTETLTDPSLIKLAALKYYFDAVNTEIKVKLSAQHELGNKYLIVEDQLRTLETLLARIDLSSQDRSRIESKLSSMKRDFAMMLVRWLERSNTLQDFKKLEQENPTEVARGLRFILGHLRYPYYFDFLQTNDRMSLMQVFLKTTTLTPEIKNLISALCFLSLYKSTKAFEKAQKLFKELEVNQNNFYLHWFTSLDASVLKDAVQTTTELKKFHNNCLNSLSVAGS